jgi:serine protease
MSTGLPANLSDANNEWVLDFSNFRSAWTKTKGAGITIAHADTGWTGHPELVDPTYRRDLSINFYEPPRYSRVCTPNDDRPSARDRDRSTAHGTGTAGVLGSPRGHPSGAPPNAADKFAERSADAYVSGAAPEAMVIPFRVAAGGPIMWDADDEALAKCIYHCIGLRANRGIDIAVMSISLGGVRAGTEKKIKDALTAARQAGIVLIAAAGQLLGQRRWWGGLFNTRFGPTFPGSSPDTICAAGCTSRHLHYENGLYGREVDISAPADNVWMSRTHWGDTGAEQYRVERSHGTSYATALTAAACALWQSYHGRQVLIEKYERPRLHAAFKLCLRRSAHLPADWGNPPPPVIPPPDERGAGVLDVEVLLAIPLPSVEDVDGQVP